MLLVALCWVGTLIMARAAFALRREVFEAHRAILRAEQVQAEGLRLLRIEQQLTQAQQISETAVAVGSGVVRAMHKGIAAIPFSILESIPATRDTTRVVRKTHDLISDAVYDSIGAVNRGIGAALRGNLQGALPAKPESPPPPLDRADGGDTGAGEAERR